MPRDYDKLVRDDIPRIVRENGERPETHVADGDEYDRRLREKLVEEADEFHEDGSLDELADVLAVVRAICDHREFTLDDVRGYADEKAAERGGFEDRIVLDRVFDGAE